jgi:hypothetical protein
MREDERSGVEKQARCTPDLLSGNDSSDGAVADLQ